MRARLAAAVVLTVWISVVCGAGLPYAVNVAVTDLRSAPIPLNVTFTVDENQQSQLLYGEAVYVLGTENDAYFMVSAPNQLVYQNNTWIGYPGFILKSALTPVKAFPKYNIVVQDAWAPIYTRSCNPFGCLPSDEVVRVSFGTWLEMSSDLGNGFLQIVLADGVTMGYIRTASVRPIGGTQATSAVRAGLIDFGLKLLGQYYLWGGRSAFSDDLWASNTQVTGVDCSGLVTILYKAFGYLLPRNAGDIFRKTSNTTQLQPGDLLFLAHPPPSARIFHVMMVVSNETIMESSYDTRIIANNGTRIVSAVEKFGIGLSELRWGQSLPHYFNSLIFWGTVLSN